MRNFKSIEKLTRLEMRNISAGIRYFPPCGENACTYDSDCSNLDCANNRTGRCPTISCGEKGRESYRSCSC
jgi:hypothetical protein